MLTGGTAIGTLILGGVLGWLQVKYDYWGKSIFQKLLVLPMSVPPYIYASLILGIFEDGGIVQWLFAWCGISLLWSPQGNTFTAILVFTAALYPYVYLLAIQGFKNQHRNLHETAQSLGLRWYERIYRLQWPLVKPWLFGAVILVLMETLADFGAVSILNQNTFTTAIYSAWYSMFSLKTATQLASMMLIFIFILLWIESLQRRKQKFTARGNSAPLPPEKCSATQNMIIGGMITLFFVLVFVMPCCQLILWVMSSDSIGQWSSLLAPMWSSVKIAFTAASVILVVSLLFNITKRWYRNKTIVTLFKISLLGYALPGTIIAVGAYSFFSTIENVILDYGENIGYEWPTFITGTVFLMVFCLTIRFLGLSIQPIEKELFAIRPQLDETAQSLGATELSILKRVLLPLLSPAMRTAFIIVFIECVKELPITLMTRPFGTDTIAIKIFEWTSEGMWEHAALPSLVLILLSLVPVLLLSKTLTSE